MVWSISSRRNASLPYPSIVSASIQRTEDDDLGSPQLIIWRVPLESIVQRRNVIKPQIKQFVTLSSIAFEYFLRKENQNKG